MAADLNMRKDNHSTIAFTLPISCQICLGKVKKPVLCPNNHVFCSPCMDVWLERNQQCPACRIAIGPANPVKKILGGLSQVDEDKDRLTSPDLRKARFNLLYKEYEEEFEKLQSEIQLLKAENQILKQKTQSNRGDDVGSEFVHPGKSDTNGLLTLTKKLQDASKLYEKLKSEMKKVRQENNSLKDGNVSLTRENERLRTEIACRSPHRYGRTTVATLETKIQNYEKEVSRLNKALEKSDTYIEDLESQLKKYQQNGLDHVGPKYKSYSVGTSGVSSIKDSQSETKRDADRRNAVLNSKSYSDSKYKSTSQSVEESATKRQLFPLDSGVSRNYTRAEEQIEIGKYRTDSAASNIHRDPYGNSRSRNSDSHGKDKSVKRVTFDLPRESNETSTFDLELPSPLLAQASYKPLVNVHDSAPVKSVLKKSNKSENSKVSSSSAYGVKSKNQHNTNSMKSRDDIDLSTKSLRKSEISDFQMFNSRDDLDLDVTGLSMLDDSLGIDLPSRHYETNDTGLDDTQVIEGELDDLNISHTSDFTDCLKLLNRAEKKVHRMEDYLEPKFLKSSGVDDFQPGSLTNVPISSSSTHKNPLDIHPNDLDFKYSARSSDLDFKYNATSKHSDFPLSTESVNDSRPSSVNFTSSSSNFYSSLPMPSYQQNVPSSDSFYSSLPLPSSQKSSARSSTYNALPLSTESESKSSLTRSPSLDSLFIQRPGHRTRRLSTDTDIPYKSDKEFVSNSELGRLPTENYGLVSSSKGRDYMTDFHPERNYAGSKLPMRTRSLSDIGSSVKTAGYNAARTTDSGPGTRSSVSSTGHADMSKFDIAVTEFRNKKMEVDRLTVNRTSVSNKPPLPRSLTSTGSKLPLPSFSLPDSKSDLLALKNKIDLKANKTKNISNLPVLSHKFRESQTNPEFSTDQSEFSLDENRFKLSESFEAFKKKTMFAKREISESNDISDSAKGSRINGSKSLGKSVLTEKARAVMERADDLVSDLNSSLQANSEQNDLYTNSCVVSSSSEQLTDTVSQTVSSYTKQCSDSVARANAIANPVDFDSVAYANPNLFHANSFTETCATDTYQPKYTVPSSSSTRVISSITSVTSHQPFSMPSSSGPYVSSSSLVSAPASRVATDFSVRDNALDPIAESTNTGRYSYLSNDTSMGELSRGSDFSLPEPKKRLFSTDDDLDFSLSPIKATRKF
ncbi:hypothetical protein ScPMuIL_009994 [Solemya velum]